MEPTKQFSIGDTEILPGETKDIRLKVSETSSGEPITIPLRVVRAKEDGPVVFVTAAVHGDELNGVGIIRELIIEKTIELLRGILILVPVVNLFGFENHSRYMPDRRDLNRCFPGNLEGSLSSRLAAVIFDEIIKKSDYGIDLHTAAGRRTNFPNVRGDLKKEEILRIAEAFGCELMVNNTGPRSSLRREAVEAGCATIIVEAGEPEKMEPAVLEIGVRGIWNVLIELGMVKGKIKRPLYQARINKTKWVRANSGGILQFHVAPGDLVATGAPIATTTTLLGDQQSPLISPVKGIVMGITTAPTVKPGEPICFLAVPVGKLSKIREAREKASDTSLHIQVRENLASSITITDPET